MSAGAMVSPRCHPTFDSAQHQDREQAEPSQADAAITDDSWQGERHQRVTKFDRKLPVTACRDDDELFPVRT